MNILIDNFISYKNKYVVNKSKKLTKYKFFIEPKIIVDIFNKLNIKYSVYNDLYYTIIKNNNSSVIRGYGFSDISILKTHFLTWPYPLTFLVILNLSNLNYNMNNNTLIVTKNYGLVELFLYYNIVNFDHFHYYLNIDEQIKISTKMKSIYSFNDYKYGIKLNKTYDFMIFDLLLTRIYDIEDNIDNSKLLKIITEKENQIILLLNNLYDYLDNLEYNKNIMILIGLYFTENTLLILEKIFSCFKYIKLFKLGYNPLIFPHIICYKFKGKQKKHTKLSINFYNFIKDVFNNTLDISYKFINKSAQINNLITVNPNSKELKEIANKNYYLIEQLAKYIGIETYNYRDNLYYELSNYMQQFYILDQTINIRFNINQTMININDIIKINNNIIQNDIQLINKKYSNLVSQQLYRSTTLLLNIESQIINNYSAINEILNTNNKNKKTKITDQWILFYELLNIINYNKLKHDQLINLLLISKDNELISPIAYYIKKTMTSYKLNHQLIKPILYKSTNIKLTENSYNLIIINDDSIDIKMIFSNILFILYNLNYGSNCIIKMIIPINNKIIIDLIYILYLSFNNLLFVKPIYKQFNTIFYIIGLGYQKQIINFTEISKILTEKEINNLSIITDDYIYDFKFQFINIYNILIKNQINIIDTKLFFTDFWHNINNSIKSEIKSAINTKNINYIEKYFNNFN